MKCRHWIAALALALPAFTGLARAEDSYWSYASDNIDVTGVGGAGYVTLLVHNLHRLDQAVRLILKDDQGEQRPPTHVFALYRGLFDKVTGSHGDLTSVYYISADANYVVIDANEGSSPELRFWNAYFGYAGSILASNNATRFPRWYRQGFSELFAATTVDRARVVVGGYNPGQVSTLRHSSLMPMRTFLQLGDGDPRIAPRADLQLYSAQSWLLLHEVLIEGLHRDEFTHYLSLIDSGQSPDAAFSASFKMSYEDLDSALWHALRNGNITSYEVRLADAPETGKAQQISTAELDGRLALLTSRGGHQREIATSFAHDSLNKEPANETALRALAQIQLNEGNFAEALQTIDRMGTGSTLSAAGYADRAVVLEGISNAVRSRRANLNVDPAQLHGRINEDLQRAIELEPENLSYWAQKARVIADYADREQAKTFFPQVVHTYYQHPGNPALAFSLARMCAATGDLDNALRFATAWQENARNAAGRNSATAFIASVKAAMERRAASAPEAPKS